MRAFRVTNTTRGVILAEQALQATGFLNRLLGLMGKPQLSTGQGLHLLPCNSIHTFFMRAPIDAVFLDRQGVVLRMYPHLRPWRATGVYIRVHSVLELPPGTLEATGTQLGDALTFESGGQS
jgi:uncharacterized protein